MEAAKRYSIRRVIVEYVDTLSPVGKLIPSAAASAPNALMEALGDGLMDAAAWRVWKTPGRPPRRAASAARPGSKRQLGKVHDRRFAANEQGLATSPGRRHPFHAGRHRPPAARWAMVDFRFPKSMAST